MPLNARKSLHSTSNESSSQTISGSNRLDSIKDWVRPLPKKDLTLHLTVYLSYKSNPFFEMKSNGVVSVLTGHW